MENGTVYGNCLKEDITTNSAMLWAWIFGISKVIELGDTVFVVLRKTPLMFLHWYHHVTVFIYTWYGVKDLSEYCLWFAGMNYFVHTIMYSYYAIKASGRRLPAFLSQCITSLQIAQMLAGVVLNILSLRKDDTLGCDINYSLAYMGLVIYSSYLALFANFFYNRYVRKVK